MAIRAVTATLCGTLLAACGGGGADSGTDTNAVSAMGETRLASIYAGRGTITKDPVKTPAATSPVADSTSAITFVRLENATAVAQTNVPFTFGQVFSTGHLTKGAALTGRLDNGETVQLQVDAKAFHPDGSVRHAIVSGVIPSLAANQARKMELLRGTSAVSNAGATTAQLLNSGFTASVSATLAGVRYTASADELIKAGKATSWLAGAAVNEWHVSAPLKNASGVAHPHLTARFAVRWFDTAKKARVDVTVENNWAYEPAPSNFTYDAEVLVGGKSVYAKPGLTHLHHARWRKIFWAGSSADIVNVKHDTAYLIATGALPNYDQSIVMKESALAAFKNGWTGAKTEPMGVGSANAYMPSTGGRDEIGILPAWSAAYLLSMDSRAKMVTLGNGDLAGSWSTHYRDKLTDRPVSIIDYPYMTILGRPSDTRNPATKKYESFPECATTTACTTPNSHDTSHQASFAYLPYLVTGDYYYLEELQFWAMYNVLSYNPIYRQTNKGILQSNQVRGQAWSLRTLAQAAYITPDADNLKSQFIGFMDNNLAWYNSTYTDNAQANPLGVIINGSAIVYDNGTGIAPWQDDFFTSAIGHASDLGFTEATRLLKWKAKFPVDRMNDDGLCWIQGAIYSMTIRSSSTAPIFNTVGDAGRASRDPALVKMSCGGAEMASFLKLKVGEMTGYSSSDKGYPSNMQPALAYSTQVSGANGKTAWNKFMNRTVKPDYSFAPQFAIIPR